MKRVSHNLVLLLSALMLTSLTSAALPMAAPHKVGMSAKQLAQLDEVIGTAIERGETPGAVVLVSRRGQVVWRKAYGARSITPTRERMTAGTIFDVASLTKPVATATSIVILVERGLVRLNDPVSRYIPEINSEQARRATIEQLLTHSAGYRPDFDLREQWNGYEAAMERLYREELRQPPGTKFIYSDIGYIALGEVVRRASGQPLDEFARRNIFRPLRMWRTGFRPRAALRRRIAPTETLRAQAAYLGGQSESAPPGAEGRWLRGEVHDPTAYRMGGLAGHAGLFSTADDLAIYCQMLLNGGKFGGRRVLSPLGVATMMRLRAAGEEAIARGLGWDINSPYSANRGDLFPLGSFGHTGFTGTSLWIDPASETAVVFLSNRLHPNGKGDVTALRGRVASVVAASISDERLSRVRESEANFAAQMLVQGAILRRAQAVNIASASATPANSTVAQTQTSFGSSPTTSASTGVLTGVDVLERDGFKPLAGLRIGLVTNHTGRNRHGKATIDVLREAPGVRLVSLFSPEHGIRGLLDEKVADSTDEKTGLPIYSLYGESRRPSPEQLKNLDALVFDIQDIGTRFYTYISTLGYVMEEAARARLPVFVLDRPNPINGTDIEGPIADADKLSFTAYHRIPVRHGMTTGELARLFNEERKTGCDLRVIKIEGWQRQMWFDSTNLTWVNPSPNMRSLTEATLYPGVGLLETTNLSVGRGTDTPFEVIGAPWLDGRQLAAYLNKRELPGVRFVPVRFIPRGSVFKGEECGGINIIVTNRSAFRPVHVGIEIAAALRRLYPAEWKVDAYDRLLANAVTLERLKRGDAPDEIARSWTAPLNEFRQARARALLY